MNDVQRLISLRTNAPMRHLAILGMGVLIWLAVAFGWGIIAAYGHDHFLATESPTRFQVLSAYLLPMAAVIAAVILIRIARQGQEPISPSRFWLGSAMMTGAAAVDLGVTFYFSPDLMNEGNPVVVVLLDSGHSLTFVILHMLLTTLAIVGLFCAFWSAALSHRPYLLETIREVDPENLMDFVKTAAGGPHLSLRQWMFPYKMSELPYLYHGIWIVGIALAFGISIFRYYVSLEWLGLIEPALWPRMAALSLGVIGSLVWYFATLYTDYQRMLTSEIFVEFDD